MRSEGSGDDYILEPALGFFVLQKRNVWHASWSCDMSHTCPFVSVEELSHKMELSPRDSLSWVPKRCKNIYWKLLLYWINKNMKMLRELETHRHRQGCYTATLLQEQQSWLRRWNSSRILQKFCYILSNSMTPSPLESSIGHLEDNVCLSFGLFPSFPTLSRTRCT